MATRFEAPAGASALELVDLRQLGASDLRPLLEEEMRAWREALEWDFSKSYELVERFVDLHALNGHALLQGGEVVGYSYYVFEEQKGLIGDLYVRSAARTGEAERMLLEGVLDALVAARVRRIEAQLMMVEHVGRSLRVGAPFLTTFERNFMLFDLSARELLPGRVRRRVFVERWADHYQEAAAGLIATAYAGHVDSRINDQYRTVTGARRFLFNIVQYPGCGAFFRPASVAAFDADSGRVAGICLASIVAPACGHITQVCVMPWARGCGVGYEMLRQTLAALRLEGCGHASLTVTASNSDAVALYERIGFRTVRRFSAYVWEGF